MTGMTSQMSFLLLQDEEDSRAEFHVGFSFNGQLQILGWPEYCVLQDRQDDAKKHKCVVSLSLGCTLIWVL